MRTQSQIEAGVCEGMGRLEYDYLGRRPKNVHAHLLGDLLVIRLQGILAAAEQHLVKSQPPERGRDLLKRIRTRLIEAARPALETMIQEIAGVKVVSLHYDLSTTLGEEIVVLTLAGSCRPQPDDLKPLPTPSKCG